VDCVDPDLAAKALDRCLEQIEPWYTLLICDWWKHSQNELPYTRIIDTLKSKNDYNWFTLDHLHKHIDTSHVLTIQTDGFVLDGSRWNPKWMELDYLGAPWPYRPPMLNKHRVGNSGLCLRSKRLLLATAAAPKEWKRECSNWQPDGSLLLQDDMFTCVYPKMRKWLDDAGFRFGSLEQAWAFSREQWVPPEYPGMLAPTHGLLDSQPFGFHGRMTPETAALCDGLVAARNGT
jgi:hypothetical protein